MHLLDAISLSHRPLICMYVCMYMDCLERSHFTGLLPMSQIYRSPGAEKIKARIDHPRAYCNELRCITLDLRRGPAANNGQIDCTDYHESAKGAGTINILERAEPLHQFLSGCALDRIARENGMSDFLHSI